MKLLARCLALLALAVPLCHAKLPPLSADAQLKADEAKAKAAWSDKVAAYQLCRAMDRAADAYFKNAKAQGVQITGAGASCAFLGHLPDDTSDLGLLHRLRAEGVLADNGRVPMRHYRVEDLGRNPDRQPWPRNRSRPTRT